MTIDTPHLFGQRYRVSDAPEDPWEPFGASDTQTGQAVVLVPLAAEPVAADGLRTVEQAMAQLAGVHCPAVEHVDGWFVEDGIPYAVGSRPRGAPLTDALRSGKLDLASIKEVARQILAALTCLHERGVAHGHLRLDSVLLDSSSRVALIDTTAARRLDAPREVMGGLYVPRAGEPLSPRADLYALGVLLYQLVTGVVPPDGASHTSDPLLVAFEHYVKTPLPPSTLWPSVPPDWDSFILSLLAGSESASGATETVERLSEAPVEEAERISAPETAARLPAAPAASMWATPKAKKTSTDRHLPLLLGAAMALAVLIGAFLLLVAHRSSGRSVALPTLQPVSGQAVALKGATMVLSWSPVKGAHGYMVQLTGPVGALSTDSKTINVAAPPAVVAVPGEGTYTWRVRARIGKRWTPYSRVSSEQVTFPRLASPSATRPPANATVRPGKQTFCWSGVAGAREYVVTIGSFRASTPSTCFTTSLRPGAYRWHVLAMAGVGAKTSAASPDRWVVVRKPRSRPAHPKRTVKPRATPYVAPAPVVAQNPVPTPTPVPVAPVAQPTPYQAPVYQAPVAQPTPYQAPVYQAPVTQPAAPQAPASQAPASSSPPSSSSPSQSSGTSGQSGTTNCIPLVNC